MGYSTSYSLSIENTATEQARKVTIDELIADATQGKITQENLVTRLQQIKAGEVEITEDLILEHLREDCENAHYALDSSGDTSDSCKWYEAKEDIKRFSKLYPTWLFTLKGVGEEAGDLWLAYFLNGKMQFEKAQIIFESFDQNKLQ